MLLRILLVEQDVLKLQVGLLEDLFEMNFVLRLGCDGIGHLDLALAQDAAGDRNTLLRRMVLNIVRALVHISSAIELVPAAWIFVALLAEVSVSTASESGKIAAEVALELNVAQAVLLAHVLLADAHVLQPAALAH